MRNKLFNNSVSLFYYAGLVIYVLLIFQRNIFLWYVWTVVIVIFLFYSKVRFNHYKKFYTTGQSIIYLLFDNITLLLGIIYFFAMQCFFFKGSHEVNIPFCLSLVIFTLPNIVGNVRLTNKEKQIRSSSSEL